MPRWLEPEKGPLFDKENQRAQRYEKVQKRLADTATYGEIKKLSESRTAGIWRIKRAKIILGTLKGKSVNQMVLDIRVPPESIIQCQERFADSGLEYFAVPNRKPSKREAGVEKILAFLENPPDPDSPEWDKLKVKYIGHYFSARQIKIIRDLILDKVTFSREQIAKEVCTKFGIYQHNGKIKVTQTQQILLRMQMDNLVILPPAKCQNIKRRSEPTPKSFQPPPKAICPCTSEIEELTITNAQSSEQLALWRELIEYYHYIGNPRLYGAQMRYLVYGSGKSLEKLVKNAYFSGSTELSDKNSYQRLFTNNQLLLGALGFSSAAWRLSSREEYIGWDDKQRERNLVLVVNNARFLILPWIKSPNLASRILGSTVRRLPEDWERRYNRRPVLLETFVQLDRFKGTCYRAANWVQIGVTDGYSLYIKYKDRATRKGIFVYPMNKNFRKILCS